MVIASRAQMLAIPVATISRRVPASSRPACVKASRPRASGIHSARYPSDSISLAASCARAAGCSSREKVQIPTRPMSMTTVSHVPAPDAMVRPALPW